MNILHIVITKYGDFLVLLVQFIRFGEMLERISRLIWLKTDKATADQMTTKLNIEPSEKIHTVIFKIKHK